MYQFHFDKNSQVIKCPIKMGDLCWFIHPYKIQFDNQYVKGLDIWCGYYCGSICIDLENIKLSHAIMLSDGKIEYTASLFETKAIAQNYISYFTKHSYK